MKARTVAIMPTYQNAGTLSAVIDGVLRHHSHLLVVDDGSTDGTREILEARGDIEVLRHEVNRGKGAALRMAFAHAHEAGYQSAITIDSDGQHDPAQLPGFLAAIESEPEALFVGARDMYSPNVPRRSRFGLRCSNLGIYVLTGRRLPDTQSGYRAYPLPTITQLPLVGDRFEFEVEVLVRAVRSGIPIRSIPIPVYYAPAGERITHFRPVQDFMRTMAVDLWLLVDRSERRRRRRV